MTATWSAWADGCDPKATFALHQSNTRIFDPASTEVLIGSTVCTGEDCRGNDGRYTISIAVPTEGMCVAQVDFVLGDALPFVGPPRSYYSSILSQGPNRLISYSRALVNTDLCGPTADASSRTGGAPAVPAAQPAPAGDASSQAITAQPAPVPAVEEPVVLGQVVSTTTVPSALPPAQAAPVGRIPVVQGEQLAFTGPTAASRSAGVSGAILILLGSVLCVSGQRLKSRQN